MRFETQPVSLIVELDSFFSSVLQSYKPVAYGNPPSYWIGSSIFSAQSDNTEPNKHIVSALLEYCKSINIDVIKMTSPNKIRQFNGVASCNFSGRKWIELSPTMPPSQEAQTLAHEVAHHLAGHVSYTPTVSLRREKELVAETISYIVLKYWGASYMYRATSYLRGFYSSSRLLELSIDRQYNTILNISNQIINGITPFLIQKEAIA